MATRGTPLDAFTMVRLQRMRRTMSVRAVARELGLSRMTVRKYSQGITTSSPLPLRRAA